MLKVFLVDPENRTRMHFAAQHLRALKLAKEQGSRSALMQLENELNKISHLEMLSIAIVSNLYTKWHHLVCSMNEFGVISSKRELLCRTHGVEKFWFTRKTCDKHDHRGLWHNPTVVISGWVVDKRKQLCILLHVLVCDMSMVATISPRWVGIQLMLPTGNRSLLCVKRVLSQLTIHSCSECTHRIAMIHQLYHNWIFDS